MFLGLRIFLSFFHPSFCLCPHVLSFHRNLPCSGTPFHAFQSFMFLLLDSATILCTSFSFYANNILSSAIRSATNVCSVPFTFSLALKSLHQSLCLFFLSLVLNPLLWLLVTSYNHPFKDCTAMVTAHTCFTPTPLNSLAGPITCTKRHLSPWKNTWYSQMFSHTIDLCNIQ